MGSKLGHIMRGGAFGLVLLGLTACVSVYRNHGHVPTESELQNVVVGVDTRDSVAETIGRPTATGVLTDSAWYYVQSRWRHYGARPPQAVERQLIAISFNDAGVVRNIERFTLEDGRVVPISRRVTDTNIADVSFIGQLLGNIGNLRADQMID